MNLLALPAVLAGFYQLLALAAAIRRLRERPAAGGYLPPVSLLKPVHGRDPGFREAIRSHAAQDYPEFEILFGVRDSSDPALSDIEWLAAEYPHRAIRVVEAKEKFPNAKVGVLAALARQARYGVLLVSDSDITAGPGYLRDVVAPLQDPGAGMVTCLYRARATSWPARFEAIGISSDFAPSVLVARMLGVSGFALGSTMVFRAQDLERIGGFEAIGDYLADDYQLGRRIAELGRSVALAGAVVETHLPGVSWAEAWRHQLRWSRAIRVSRSGFYGYAITNAAVWSILACAAGDWAVAAAAMAIRMAAGLLTGARVLGDRQLIRYWFLIPLRDLWGFAVWLAALSGDTVEWRGIKLRLGKDGRIESG